MKECLQQGTAWEKKGGLGEMQHLSESLKTQIKIVLMLLWFRGDWKEQF